MSNKQDDNHFANYFNEVTQALQTININELNTFVDAVITCYNNSGIIYIFGNGGSSATASHVAGDFVKGISYGLDKRLKVLCFNDNYPGLSAIANDISFDDIFAEQLKNFINPNDLVVGISGSGNSKNVVKALEYAKTKNVKTAIFCGYTGGKAKKIADFSVHIPITDMEMTEDIHLLCFHAIKQRLIQLINSNQKSLGKKYDSRMNYDT